MDKVMSMKEAISTYVHDGDFLYIGGYICRPPFAVIHEIIRQGIKNLTITRSNAGDDFDMMIGAGVVHRFISTFLSLNVYGLGRCYRRSMAKLPCWYHHSIRMSLSFTFSRPTKTATPRSGG